ncbi:PAS domain S-box protein [Xanthocytophaga agilis]|uniref:PAS domain S-box protein n=1 Tax=Xanthocytophaga agilis TaxID=3048010 RepID=A0AAE3RAU7_9BACT|nr:PAS domain S-box protein [Xanthocytophaga agilis]MDJ1506871.1 PAS domain S-box protein [Xanthocytophaga agilis]
MLLPFALIDSKKLKGLQKSNTEYLQLCEQNQQASTFIRQIEEGNLQADFALIDDSNSTQKQNPLIIALASMRQRMKEIARKEHERTWTTEGLARFVEILREKNTYGEQLYDAILANLIKYMGANQGGLFVVHAQNDDPSTEDTLEMVACYAYDRKKYIRKQIVAGEGLTGQCYLEGETIYLTDIPGTYVHITSGLGKSAPHCLVLVPLKLNDQVLGVVELASFNSFEPYHIAFVEKLGESIASTIANAHVYQRTQELLAQSQKQTENLQLQEEVLRQNMEEMAATQEEMQRKLQENARLKGELDARMHVLNQAALLSESDLYGNITFVNDRFCEVSGWSREEALGKPHNVVRHPENPKSLYKDMWTTIKSGRIFRGTFKNRAKNGTTYWVDATIAPVLDAEGNPIKYIGIRYDITEQFEKSEALGALLKESQLQQEQLKAQEDVLRESMDALSVVQEEVRIREAEAQNLLLAFRTVSDTFACIEFDMQGNILKANVNFLQTVGYEEDEIQGQQHRLFVDPVYAQSTDYVRFWQNLQQGNAFTGEVVRLKKDKTAVWMQVSYAPVRDNAGKYYKVVKLAIDITHQKQLEIAAQQQMEELKAQEEELRQNMEELITSQEEIERQSIELRGLSAAVNSTLATIEFDPTGKILTANSNFLNLMGYKLEQIVGRSHAIFVDPSHVISAEYRIFWEELSNGHPQVGEARRFTKNGEEKWLSASYTPVFGQQQEVIKVIKFAQDVTQSKLQALDSSNQLTAINKVYAIVEFDIEGNVLHANRKFLDLMGYDFEEISGKHHSLFVLKQDAESAKYKHFWQQLRKGEFVEGIFERLNSEGQKVHIRGSYNPIVDMHGKVYKIIKHAQKLDSE